MKNKTKSFVNNKKKILTNGMMKSAVVNNIYTFYEKIMKFK